MRPAPHPPGKKQPLFFKNTDGAIGRTDPFEGVEKKAHSLLDLLIGVQEDPVVGTIDKPCMSRGTLSSPRRALLRMPPRSLALR
jgi:hypothetical protein